MPWLRGVPGRARRRRSGRRRRCEIATVTDRGSVGCGRIVWKAWPPNPAPHSARCGWSHSARSSANVSPRSVERQTAPGSVPAYTTPSSLPGTSCQIRSTLALGVLGEAHRAVRRLLPARAEVVGAAHLRAEPARRRARQQPRGVAAGVDEAGVDLLHVEVRPGELPLLARLVGRADPQPLAGPDHQQRPVRPCLPPGRHWGLFYPDPVTARKSSLPLASPVWLVLVGILSVQFGAGVAKSHLRRGLADRSSCGCGWRPARWSWRSSPGRCCAAGRRQDWYVVLAFGATLGPDELVDLPVVPADPARHRGDARVRRAAHAGRPRLATGPRPAVGGARRRSASRCSGWSGGGSLNVARRPASRCSRERCWAAYILLSAQTGRRWPGFDGLAVASVVAAAAARPRSRSAPAAPTCSTPGSCCSAPLVGLLSSVIPYTLRAGRAALAAAVGLLDPDEPRAGRRRPRRHARPPGVPHRRAVAGDGLHRDRLGRRHPLRAAAVAPVPD